MSIPILYRSRFPPELLAIFFHQSQQCPACLSAVSHQFQNCMEAQPIFWTTAFTSYTPPSGFSPAFAWFNRAGQRPLGFNLVVRAGISIPNIELQSFFHSFGSRLQFLSIRCPAAFLSTFESIIPLLTQVVDLAIYTWLSTSSATRHISFPIMANLAVLRLANGFVSFNQRQWVSLSLLSLTSIYIEDPAMSTSTALSILSQLTSLEQCTILPSHNVHVQQRPSLTPIAHPLGPFPQLRHVTISALIDIEILLNPVSIPCLRTLVLNQTISDSTGFETAPLLLTPFLSNCHTLESLYIHFTLYETETLLCDVLPHLPRLIRLALRWDDNTPETLLQQLVYSAIHPPSNQALPNLQQIYLQSQDALSLTQLQTINSIWLCRPQHISVFYCDAPGTYIAHGPLPHFDSLLQLFLRQTPVHQNFIRPIHPSIIDNLYYPNRTHCTCLL
ncbi:hypothetical protein BDN72DRAFT_901254 [Pluteus cervinus]|uniref:Uncharacterized protein n=1 Tax=Pluteus cervinus TaxID=181527 RepID=A0ACD3AGE0_9AGAR|nr:hypothetical protein BDN72DRAFT_901254 [Pluteus cervinus]